MPSYSLSDPVVSTFVIIPALLSGVFAWGVGYAWRRAGESRREWDRNPPPFMLLVFGIGALAVGIVLSPLGDIS